MQDCLERYADLIINFGANVQPGQILDVGSGLGKEELTRALTASAYKRGAKFVDVNYWDPFLKRVRVQHAADDVLDFVPPWYGERTLQLGEGRGATILLSGPIAPSTGASLPDRPRSGRSSCTPSSSRPRQWRSSGSRCSTSAGWTTTIRSRRGASGATR